MAEGQKKFPIAMIAVVGVLLLLLAGGVSYFIASYIAGGKAPTSKYEPGVLYKVGDPKEGLIVNIGGGNTGHFVKTSIILELRPMKSSAAKESKGLSHEEVKMTDAVVRVLRAQKAEDFDAGKQEAIRDKIKSEVNAALGEDIVMHVYITSFVLQ